MKSDVSGEIACPRCLALNNPGSSVCFLCEQPLPQVSISSPPKLGQLQPASGPRFRVASLLLVIALIAVALGVFRQSPGLAIVLVIPGGIALVRSLTLNSRNYNEPATTGDRVAAFLATFGIVVLVMVASAIAFFVTCFAVCSIGATGPGDSQVILPVLLGGIAALGVAISIPVAIVRDRRKRRRMQAGWQSEKRD